MITRHTLAYIPKLPCTCGYETEHRCFVHPGRPAHIMTNRIWLCHDCMHELGSNYSDHNVAHLIERRWVLCPNCAWDEAAIENEQRELDKFLNVQIVDEDPVI